MIKKTKKGKKSKKVSIFCSFLNFEDFDSKKALKITQKNSQVKLNFYVSN